MHKDSIFVEEISIESKLKFGSVIHKLARPEFVQFKRLLRSWTRIPEGKTNL